jgi:hypothetical protein
MFDSCMVTYHISPMVCISILSLVLTRMKQDFTPGSLGVRERGFSQVVI